IPGKSVVTPRLIYHKHTDRIISRVGDQELVQIIYIMVPQSPHPIKLPVANIPNRGQLPLIIDRLYTNSCIFISRRVHTRMEYTSSESTEMENTSPLCT